MIANLFGFESAAQVANEEKYRQHAVKLEEAHQRFGLDKEFDHEGTRKQADILFRRKQVSLEYRWSQIKNFWRLGTIEDAARDEARMQAEQQAMDSETKRRATIEAQWNNGLDGAINRVLENEKRRWLRAVEQDRAARFASWSLT